MKKLKLNNDKEYKINEFNNLINSCETCKYENAIKADKTCKSCLDENINNYEFVGIEKIVNYEDI